MVSLKVINLVTISLHPSILTHIGPKKKTAIFLKKQRSCDADK